MARARKRAEPWLMGLFREDEQQKLGTFCREELLAAPYCLMGISPRPGIMADKLCGPYKSTDTALAAYWRMTDRARDALQWFVGDTMGECVEL